MNATSSMAANVPSRSRPSLVFISYRRSDAAGYGARIFEKLARKLKGRVFWDGKAIGPGDNFVDAISGALRDSSVVLAVVGSDWAHAKDENGEVRLFNPDDFVRREIEIALEEKIEIIPVLVGGATLPSPNELPAAIRGFLNFQAFELSNTRWNYDLNRLIVAIRPTVDPWFRLRRMAFALAVLAVVIGGWIVTDHIVENARVKNAIETAKGADVDKAIGILEGLRKNKSPEGVNPKIPLAEAQVYQIQGDALKQNDAAEEAVKLAHGDAATLGMAKGLACDAKFRLEHLDEALHDCEDAAIYSTRAHDPVGQVRAINYKASIQRTKNPDEALKGYRNALEVAQKNGLSLDEYGAWHNIGLVLIDSEKPTDRDEARRNFATSKSGFEQAKEYGEASNVCNTLGTDSRDQGNITEAKGLFDEAVRLAVKGNDKSREAQARLNSALVSEQLGQLQNAESELKATLEIYGRFRRPSDQVFVLNALGDVHLQLARLADAKEDYEKAESLTSGNASLSPGSKSKQLAAHALALAKLVNVDFERGQGSVPDLIERIDNSIQEALKANQRKNQEATDSETFARIVKAKILLASGKRNDAETEAQKALAMSTDNDDQDGQVDSQIVLAEIQGMGGALTPALDQLKKIEDSTATKNMGQSYEAQLIAARLKAEAKGAALRNQGRADLQSLSDTARKWGYILIADKAATL